MSPAARGRYECSGLNGSPLKAGADFLGVPIVSANLAVGGAFAHRMPKVVGEVEHVVGADRGAVGIGEADILAPGAQEFPFRSKTMTG